MDWEIQVECKCGAKSLIIIDDVENYGSECPYTTRCFTCGSECKISQELIPDELKKYLVEKFGYCYL